MNKAKLVAIAAGVVVAAFAVVQFLPQEKNFQPQAPAVTEPEKEPDVAAPAEPQIAHPIEPIVEPEAPIPPLDESDASFSKTLSELIGADAFKRLFFPTDIVRRLVVTIDNLPRETAADRLRPVQPAPGVFQIQQDGERMMIAPSNAARYAPYINAFEKLNAQHFSAMYRRFYPLFQSAFQDLGYPNAHFNDRLVAVIDHMLAAPPLTEPVALVQPHVFYHYANPTMQSASAGHKLMWRIGNDNAARVKAKLRDIRAVIASR